MADFSRPVVDYVTDPRTGIASESKFLPNIAEVRAACVQETQRRERLAKPSISVKREYLPPPQRPPDSDYYSMFEKHGRPTGFFETGHQYVKRDIPAVDPVAEQSRLEAANRAYFERECREEGIDPSRGVSPSLLKALGVRNAG